MWDLVVVVRGKLIDFQLGWMWGLGGYGKIQLKVKT